MKLRIILSFILLLLSSYELLAKDPDWLNKMKQIKLLSDNRVNVLKLLGNPVDNDRENHLWYYDFEQGRMAITYATRTACNVTTQNNKKIEGWSVPEYSVVEMSFSLNKHIKPKNSFINLNGFTKTSVKYAEDYSDGATPDDHRRAPYLFEYKNNELGIYYFEEYGKISEIRFYPSRQFDYLRCSE